MPGILFNSLKDGKSIVYKNYDSPYDDNAEIDTVYIDDTPVRQITLILK